MAGSRHEGGGPAHPDREGEGEGEGDEGAYPADEGEGEGEGVEAVDEAAAAERAMAATALQARVRGRRSRLSAAGKGGHEGGDLSGGDAAAYARVEHALAALLQEGYG